MKNPVSTYRVQLSPEYTFDDLNEILDYLEEFGISTVYSAPFFQARQGSSHGYDIIDPFRLNKEIGRLDMFRKISSKLKQKNMSWLQDIVPNHMAFDGNNVWLQDIFELGPESTHYKSFDIDWEQSGKVMAPFLGNPLAKVIKNKELQLKVSKKGFFFKYFDHEYLAAARSYASILGDQLGGKWEEKFRNLSVKGEKWQELKEYFLREYQKDPEFRNKINSRIKEINASEENLKEMLEEQYFLPAHWKETEENINYRRFFTINDLICLRMEDKKVFESYHRFILQLCEENLIHGLRIDHIDGLLDPKEYLEWLREKLGPDFYITIEKILEWDEKLPVHWPVEGTSGYGFLATVNQLLTDPTGEEKFLEAYQKLYPKNSDYNDLVYEQKLFILTERMGGEYKNLWEMALNLDLLEDEENNRKALGAFLAAFPVYRIYPEEYPLRKRQKKIIESAFQTAQRTKPELEKELEKVKDVFLGEAQKDRDNMLQFLQRCQQFTGPLAAKGVEDTTFYIFNELISHNEVGDSPENFGLSVAGFHERMKLRMEDFPLSINATATHDTKRGEDARMRINVLSEIGGEWFKKVEDWREIAKDLRKDPAVPDANEEYFIFQMLIGAWPHSGEPGEEFLERSTAYLQKVLREAKEHSSWADPNIDYENKVFDFLKALLNSSQFKDSFEGFQKKISAYGALKSLSQSLLKITAPGIPDVYQGTELWDLSYVDPDNRRPVDYELRKKYLSELNSVLPEDLQQEIKNLKQDYTSGKIKMFCIHRALNFRLEIPGTFEKGEYVQLEVKGEMADKILAFARRDEENAAIIVVPVMVVDLFTKDLQVQDLQQELKIVLPKNFTGTFKNVFSGEEFSSEEIAVKDLFKDFPVALLKQDT
ncbi:malto-oligosyltrehalose synthase [Salinimicrobium sp. TH3]|uniref:malto-oligosyltrehalose synthase n=1 Tax=Salinimicrobium sp. TH3 TaxID=2997342 RepID=UPI00227360D2|nr:malto-oligosyltrehalose synthase [Salinimicrobium sp. TH3]MCY2687163.1 malto-oligosyltrehalose synthase [Salinimicrobium sp. TH3]